MYFACHRASFIKQHLLCTYMKVATHTCSLYCVMHCVMHLKSNSCTAAHYCDSKQCCKEESTVFLPNIQVTHLKPPIRITLPVLYSIPHEEGVFSLNYRQLHTSAVSNILTGSFLTRWASPSILTRPATSGLAME